MENNNTELMVIPKQKEAVETLIKPEKEKKPKCVKKAPKELIPALSNGASKIIGLSAVLSLLTFCIVKWEIILKFMGAYLVFDEAKGNLVKSK